MFWNKAKRDPFSRALSSFGWGQCSLLEDRLMIGLPPDEAYQRVPVTAVPRPLTRVHFLQAPLQADLVTTFAKSDLSAEVQSLFLGTSHDYAEKKLGAYDMRAAVRALAGGSYPKLDTLCLGDMHMLFNGHRYFGKLGEIGDVLSAMPALKAVTLHGQCALSRPLRLSRLQELFIEADDIGMSGGAISPATVERILASDLPELETLELALDEEEVDWAYEISEAQLADLKMPRLTGIWVECLSEASQARLDAFRKGLPPQSRPTGAASTSSAYRQS